MNRPTVLVLVCFPLLKVGSLCENRSPEEASGLNSSSLYNVDQSVKADCDIPRNISSEPTNKKVEKELKLGPQKNDKQEALSQYDLNYTSKCILNTPIYTSMLILCKFIIVQLTRCCYSSDYCFSCWEIGEYGC